MNWTYVTPVLAGGLLAGKTGMIVAMFLTSILVLGFGFMALRLRSAILNTMGELSSKMVSKFVIPEGGGSGSMSASLSATGNGGSGGGSGGAGSAVSTAVNSAAAGAGSNVGKALVAGSLGMGAVGIAGKVAGSKDSEEHASVATGAADEGNMNSTTSMSDGDMSVANAQAGDVSAESASNSVNQAQADAEQLTQSVATGGEFSSGTMNSEIRSEKSEKEMGMTLMNADSLAGATHGVTGQNGRNGSGKDGVGLHTSSSANVSSDRREAVAGEAGPQSGNAYSDAHVDGRGENVSSAESSSFNQGMRNVNVGAANDSQMTGNSQTQLAGSQSFANANGSEANIHGVSSGAANDKVVQAGFHTMGSGSMVETRNVQANALGGNASDGKAGYGEAGKAGVSSSANGVAANIRSVSAGAMSDKQEQSHTQSQMQSYADLQSESQNANVNVPVRGVSANVMAGAAGEAGKSGSGYGVNGSSGVSERTAMVGQGHTSGSYRQSSQMSSGSFNNQMRSVQVAENAHGQHLASGMNSDVRNIQTGQTGQIGMRDTYMASEQNGNYRQSSASGTNSANIRGVGSNVSGTNGMNGQNAQSQMQSYADLRSETQNNVPVHGVSANAMAGVAGEAGKAGSGYGVNGANGVSERTAMAGQEHSSGSYRQSSQMSNGSFNNQMRAVRTAENGALSGNQNGQVGMGTEHGRVVSDGAANIHGVGSGVSGKNGQSGTVGVDGRGVNGRMAGMSSGMDVGHYRNHADSSGSNMHTSQNVPIAGRAAMASMNGSGMNLQQTRDTQRQSDSRSQNGLQGSSGSERMVAANIGASVRAANAVEQKPSGSGSSGRMTMGRGGVTPRPDVSSGSYRETSGMQSRSSDSRFAMPVAGAGGNTYHTTVQSGGSSVVNASMRGANGSTVVHAAGHDNYGRPMREKEQNDKNRSPQDMQSPVFGTEPQGNGEKGVTSVNGLRGSNGRSGSAAPGQMIRKNEKQHGSYKNTAGSDDFI